VLVCTPDGTGLPLAWRVTTLCGRTFTTSHVDLGGVAHVECPECAQRLATPAPDRSTTLALVRFTPPAPPRREAA
jgi:hypothetical protein